MRLSAFTSLFFLILVSSTAAWSTAREIDPIVSTDWLEMHLDTPDLLVLDVRPATDYAAGHIPGAVNEPFVVPESAWIVLRDGLLLELPEQDALAATIASLGIDRSTRVVVVSAPNPNEPPHYGMSAATRVADTLIYAGMTHIAVLDGGFNKWLNEEKVVSTESVEPIATVFDGEFDEEMFVSQTYVLRNAWRSKLIDARDADVYFGVVQEPFTEKAGHIFSAASLPAPWAYIEGEAGSYTFQSIETLAAMAEGVLGPMRSRKSEIIVYCGVGGYTSVWWYLFHEVLGYPRVKFYDGSAQEWALDYEMVLYRWQH